MIIAASKDMISQRFSEKGTKVRPRLSHMALHRVLTCPAPLPCSPRSHKWPPLCTWVSRGISETEGEKQLPFHSVANQLGKKTCFPRSVFRPKEGRMMQWQKDVKSWSPQLPSWSKTGDSQQGSAPRGGSKHHKGGDAGRQGCEGQPSAHIRG